MRQKLRWVAIGLGILIVIGFAAVTYEVLRTVRVTERLSAIKQTDRHEIPYMVERLHDYNFMIRAKAAGQLAIMVGGATEAYPDLLRALKDPSANVRCNATAAFMYIGDANCIPALIDGLDDESSEVRRCSACALRENGTLAAAAVPKLTERLDDPLIACWVAEALGAIGAPAKASIPKIIAKMQTETDLRRLNYIVALEKFGGDAKASIPHLQALSSDPDPLVSQAATKAIQTISAPAPVNPQPK